MEPRNLKSTTCTAYVQPAGASDFEGFDILKEVNVRILETAVQAVERVSPKLRFWTLQTGGKVYLTIYDPFLNTNSLLFSHTALYMSLSWDFPRFQLKNPTQEFLSHMKIKYSITHSMTHFRSYLLGRIGALLRFAQIWW